MSEQTQSTRHEASSNWTARNQSGGAPSSLARFLGGSPGHVFLKLIFVSLIIGAFLKWFDIRPGDIIWGIDRLIHRVGGLGLDTLREIADYVLAGAMIVIPIWLVLRLLNMRSPR
jgi:hypothetical protein